MKFIYLIFTLLFVLFLKSALPASNSYASKHFSASRDTIIQLDSVKDRKLLPYKPKKDNQPIKLRSVDVRPDNTKNNKQPGLSSEIKGVASDSTREDKDNQVLYFFGAARVTYQDFELDADFIRVDQKNHLIFASGLHYSKNKQYIGRPIFLQKNDKPIKADSILFNYDTKKGKIYNVETTQDENHITGGQAKRLNETEVAYKNVIFSTCDLPYPDTHFGIVITKGIAEKHSIISGPAYLEIEGVPLPLFIPFGFFPKPDQRSSGVILPTFGEDQQLGFFLKGFGYYLGLSDYLDLTNTGSYYTKGSYDINSTAHYLKRYKYQGTLSLSYGSHKYGLETDPAAKDFNIQWSHTQDPDAHPGTTFSASVNAGTSSFFQHSPGSVNYNLQALTQNTLRSSISYGKSWPGSPFNFTANLSHSQDLNAKTVTLELPSFNLNMTTLNPFDSKDRVGEQKWYQRITIGYNLQATNKVTAVPESQLFTSATLTKRFQNGFSQQIPVGLSLNILHYFQFNSSINYSEVDYFQTIRKHFARGSISGMDSLVIDTVSGFKRGYQYGFSSGFSTKVYGTMNFRGKIKAIRHVMSPSVSFQYRPDFSDPKYGYYNTIVSSATVPYPYTKQSYSIFEQGVYQGPSGGRQAGLALSVDNSLEMKVRANSSDTSGQDKKISIFQGLSFSTFYNFLADSMKLSDIGFSGRTSLFNQKLGINFGGNFHPYITQVRDSVANNQVVRYARDINRYSWQDGRLPRLTNFNISMSMSLNSDALHHPSNNQQTVPNPNTLANMTPAQKDRLALINSNPNAYVDFNIPWNINLSYNFNYSNTGISTSTSNTVNFSGDLKVTDNWVVRYNSGYDIKQLKVSSTSLSIYRDLHCWDLAFSWIPFGFYKYYSVDLKVKASILQDLKISKRKDYYNNY